MGWNTGVVILNDALNDIERYPEEFVSELMKSMRSFLNQGGKPVDVSVNGHVNAASVFHQSHADETGVFAIGGNHATRLLKIYNGGNHHTDADKLSLLKSLANEMGYNISKKPDKTKNKELE